MPSATLCLPVDATMPDRQVIGQAAALIQAGQLVAFPTETVYGLGADALQAAAVERIFQAKGRPSSDPLIVHVAAVAELERVAINIPAIAYELAERFWPGPLTLVLQRHQAVPAAVSAGLPSVAVRVPAHPVALALISAAGVPVAAPSANRFSRPSPTSAQHVLDDLAGQVALVLDAGTTRIGLESTVVDLCSNPARILRPGGVDAEALRGLLPELAYTPRFQEVQTAQAAPGGLLRHYAPDIPLWIVRGSPAAVLHRLRGMALEAASAGQRIGILAVAEDQPALADLPADLVLLGSQDDLATVGQRLFAAIRGLERRDLSMLLVRELPQAGIGLAIWDRFIRAAEGRVIEAEEL